MHQCTKYSPMNLEGVQILANCRKCGQEVNFKPHPKNAEKLAPFDEDGEIHFARCKSDKPKTSCDG